MSEPAYKRRVREWKRRVTTDLTLQGYEVDTFDQSVFHLQASRCGRIRRIRFCFRPDEREADRVRQASPSSKCIRELWIITDGGRKVERTII